MKGDDFWLNPETALSNLCQTIILKSGLPVRQIARALHKGEDLIYKWCNPNAPQLPSLLQFLELVRVTRQHNALAEICEIFERLGRAGNLWVKDRPR
jgi:hypothetical protein